MTPFERAKISAIPIIPIDPAKEVRRVLAFFVLKLLKLSGQVSQEAYIWPLDGYTRLSDTFGERICPFHGKEFHDGVDIPAPGGTNIMASASGVVTKATYSSSFGNNITIDHGNGVETMYLHCSALAVEEGDHVEQGQVIAYVGTTGSSTGNHLDFRFKVNGEYVDPLSMVQP